MGKPKAPPAPDYSGVAAANAQAAQYSFELGKEQLAWAKQTYASDKATTDKVVSAALDVQARNDATAAQDRERYETQFQPLEDKFVQKALDYNSPARSDANAARALGDVSQQFEIARDNARQQLEAYGVDPSQTRAAALDLGTRTQEAAARASAANTSRFATEAQGNALLAGAIDIGKGYPGSVATQYGTGAQAGSQAVGSSNQTTATGASTMGTGASWQGLGNQSLGGWSNALTAGYNGQMQRFNAQNSQSSGIGGLLGSVAGMGVKLATGGLFAEGGAVDDVTDAAAGYPDDPALHSGITISREMSPSGGAQTDDVNAKLNAGEFIIPDDAVRWLGEKHLQNVITKAREEKQGAVAKPKVGVLPVGEPQVQTAPQGALQVRR